jgi:integrase/recombinase XerD
VAAEDRRGTGRGTEAAPGRVQEGPAVTAEVLHGDLVPTGDMPGGVLAVPGSPEAVDLVRAWLLACAKTPDSLRAYRTGIEQWLAYCAGSGLDPVDDVQRVHADAWLRHMEATPTARTGRPPSKATCAQRVAIVASFYEYLVDDGRLTQSPVRRRGRPKAPTESATVGLSRSEAAAFRRRCREKETPLDRAVLDTLLGCGLRVSELIGADLADIAPEEGETVLTVVGKGGKVRKVVCGAGVVDAITGMVEQRAARAGVPADELPVDAPLFATAAGARLSDRSVSRLVQRVARAAGITSWARLSPHSLRHTCATMQLDAGVPIDRVQHMLGHADTRTTQRYDRARGALHRSGAHRLDQYLAEAEHQAAGR